MRALFRKFRDSRFRYESIVSIIIHRESIIHNLRQFETINPGVSVAPVLKSNAYGHGLVQVAKILDKENLPFLCVDSYVEALVLRNEGIRTPILIIGYTPVENILRNRLKKISFGVMSLEELKTLSKENARAAIHLKIDTGMHRQGVMTKELTEALQTIRKSKRLTLEGIYSHLADADTPTSDHAAAQIKKWNLAARQVREMIPTVKYFHLSNTAGVYYSDDIDANVMRLGIGLYGFNTSPRKTLDLEPVLEMKTRITSVRALGPSEKIGYNATFEVKNKMVVATIPVGYSEGVDRRLSSLGSVTMNGIPCPIVGRVNMNITSVDVSAVKDPKVNDEVLVVSADPKAPNSIQHMADLCKTIPYELLVHLPAQLRRTITE